MTKKDQQRRDPLSDLFSNVQLTGLAKPKSKRHQEAPLQIDLPEISTEQKPQKAQMGLKRPKSPPRYMGEPYESYESDVEVEELDSDEEWDAPSSTDEHAEVLNSIHSANVPEKVVETENSTPSESAPPQQDMQAKLKLILAQQQMTRRRIALKKEREAQQRAQSTPIETTANSVSADPNPEARAQVEDRLNKLNSKRVQQAQSPSAMDLFLAAAAESEQSAKLAKVGKVEKVEPKQRIQQVAKNPQIQAPSVEPVGSVPAAPKPLMGNRLMLTIEELIRTQLPVLKQFHVASALDSFDRPLMRAIWSSHRTKFLINGQLEYAVAAVSVMDALEQVGAGELVAAYVETTASDYLIWIDLPNKKLLAAFADAKSYFASE